MYLIPGAEFFCINSIHTERFGRTYYLRAESAEDKHEWMRVWDLGSRVYFSLGLGSGVKVLPVRSVCGICVCVFVCACVLACVCECVYVCVYVCVCV